ncbi:MAG: putative cytokinetic ring protein SteA [Armatimonadota bacterium]
MKVFAADRAVVAIAELSGRVRVDERTKRLVQRLRKGEIAVIAHQDIDVLAARALIERAPRAVINADRSFTGKFPTYGALMLLQAGIPILDGVGRTFFEAVSEGEQVRIVGSRVVSAKGVEAQGVWLHPETLQREIEAARARISEELRAFAANTLAYMQQEWQLLLEPLPLPRLRTALRGKQVVVVVRGPNYERDLDALRAYLREARPILIAVDGAADALLQRGLKPHLIVGDMDSVSESALRCGAELVVHGYLDPDRPSPGWERCQRLGLEAHLLRAPGTSEDVAMLLAYESDAELIVAVGSHFSLEEFLEKGRAGMASTLLTRLKVGSRLVDAKGVSRLFQHRRPMGELAWLFLAALAPIIVAIALSPTGRFLVKLVRTWWRVWFG